MSLHPNYLETHDEITMPIIGWYSNYKSEKHKMSLKNKIFADTAKKTPMTYEYKS